MQGLIVERARSRTWQACTVDLERRCRTFLPLAVGNVYRAGDVRRHPRPGYFVRLDANRFVSIAAQPIPRRAQPQAVLGLGLRVHRLPAVRGQYGTAHDTRRADHGARTPGRDSTARWRAMGRVAGAMPVAPRR